MERTYSKREKTEFIKLIILGFIVILLYLAISFEPVYGYNIWAFERIMAQPYDNTQIENPPKFSSALNSSYWESESLGNDGNGWIVPDEFEFEPNTDEKCPPVPEPTTLLLVGLGSAAFVLRRKFLK